ncbi:MAG: methyltransferase domain-containing protein [Nanoarchaeota archaeon]|mgnify:CR=1 FL=1
MLKKKPSNVELPKGYSLVNGSIRIGKSDGGASETDIYPNNHDFAFYDKQFYGILSKYLRDHEDIALLDIGGGGLSLSVQQIMQKFPNAKAINIDLLAGDGPFSIHGNAAELLADEKSIDAVISVSSVAYLLIPKSPEAEKIVEGMVRVLKPSGYVFISPGVDLTIWSSGLEAVTSMYGKNTYGKVYTRINNPKP